MSHKIRDRLLTELFVSSENHHPENLETHTRELLRYRFDQLFHFSEGTTAPYHPNDTIKIIPAEKEIRFLLEQGSPDLFLENIFYHLRRNNLHLPPALIPGLLTRFKPYPRMWHLIHQNHPALVPALSSSFREWEYMNQAFDPEFVSLIGSPLFYESLIHRLRLYPDETARWIRDAFPSASEHHQNRLLEVLGMDPYPETEKFFLSLLKGQRKQIRIIALKTLLRKKYQGLYVPLIGMMRSGSKEAKEIRRLHPHFWKDLFSFSGFTEVEDALTAVTDPADYPASDPASLNQEATLQAALFHRSQTLLIERLAAAPKNLAASDIVDTMSSSSAIRAIQKLYLDQDQPLDQTFFDLLVRIRPHMNEAMTSLLQEKFKAHRAELSFFFDPYPLELWALRIHPNLIRKIWQDPDLQTTEPGIQTFRDILKYRLDFLKKCYPKP